MKTSSKQQIQSSVNKARTIQIKWQQYGLKYRLKDLETLYTAYQNHADQIARTITNNVSKPITESRSEVKKGLSYFQYYLDHAPKYLKEITTFKEAPVKTTVVFEPKGVSAVILPWNFPFMLYIWGTIPNLIVGNSVIVKHSELSQAVSSLLEDLSSKSKPVLSFIYGNGTQGEYLAKQDIDLIWFTGSSQVGKQLYKIAANKFIDVVLEMGGSNPAIVFDDIDIDATVKSIYAKRFLNCGQYCTAAKRLIVQDSIADRVVQLLVKIVEAKTVGDPLDPKTDIGPLITDSQLKLLEEQVTDAIDKGATIKTGGRRLRSLGDRFFQPTIITNISPDMEIWKQEVFGPVLPIVNFKDTHEAIRLANDSKYGLGAQIFTKDIEKAKKVASELKVGMVDINNGKSSLPCNPFGGVKASGKGREHGQFGFRDLCNIKTISIG